MANVALVLTGGGARGAYQAGFLKGIADMMPGNPFNIITGCSVGSINAAFLACQADNFQGATEKLWNMWATIKPEGIFVPRSGVFLKIALNLIAHMLFGYKKPLATTLLDDLPLKNMLRHELDFEALHKNIENNKLLAAAFTAIDYNKRISTTFF